MTARLPAELVSLLRLANAGLGPYRDQAVLVGGLAPFVYQHHAAFDREMPLPVLGTKDADMTVPLPLPILAGKTLHSSLVDGGLVADVGRGTDGKDSITRFFLPGRTRNDAPYLEFLVRDAGRKTAMAGLPQADLLAHTGHFQELLLAPTPAWSVEVPSIGAVRVPHPLGYIAQKTRMHEKRRAKWAKDQGDVLLVIWGFHALWPDIRHVWTDLQRRSPQGAWLASVLTTWKRLYARPDSEGPLAVADIYRQRTAVQVPAVALHRVMQDFLEVMSG